MNNENLPILEAVLFAAGDPLSLSEIADILELDEIDTLNLLNELEEALNSRNSGITLQNVPGGCYQLLTRPEYYFAVKKLAGVKEKKLSTPTMETLSIIAFKQPITKQEIENIRGVRIERSLARLLEVNLIEERGRKDILGHPILYGTTDVFLRTFGLKSLKELPNLPNADDIILGAQDEALKELNINDEEFNEIQNELKNEYNDDDEFETENDFENEIKIETENKNENITKIENKVMDEVENENTNSEELKFENVDAIQKEVLKEYEEKN